MASTLEEYADNRKKELENVRDQTKTTWSTALDDEQKAKTDAAAKREDLAGVEREVAAIRIGLAASATPGQAEALSDELRTKLIERKGLRAELLDLEQALALAGAERELLQATLAQAEKELVVAQKTLDQAKADTTKRTALETTATGSELAQLIVRTTALVDAADPSAPAAATGDEDGKLVQAARDRVDGDIPEDLQDRSRGRMTAARDALGEVEGLAGDLLDAIDTHLGSGFGESGQVEAPETAFQRAEDALNAFAIEAPNRLAQALALLAKVRDSRALTTDEKAKIGDTDLASDAAGALTLEATLNTAGTALATAEAALELATANALIADSYADPDANAAVQTAQGTRDGAVTARDNASAALTLAERAKLDAWEVEIPDLIWANLVDYDEALAILSTISETVPSTLVSTLDAAESSLAQALEDAHKASLAGQLANAILAATETRHAARANLASARLLSAARGDH